MKPRILFIDCETSPNIGYTWGKYEQDVIEFTKQWGLLSFAWGWADSPVQVIAKDRYSEKSLLVKIHAILSQAEVVVAQNGDAFDIKKLNTLFLQNRMPPPTPFKTIDTLKVAQARFALSSNKLDDIGKSLKEGEKIKHRGFDMWVGCMAGKQKDFDDMKRYNKGDVELLRRIYKRFLPWIKNHPALSAFKGFSCPRCGSNKFQNRGTRITVKATFARFQCRSCGGWVSGAKQDKTERLNTL